MSVRYFLEEGKAIPVEFEIFLWSASPLTSGRKRRTTCLDVLAELREGGVGGRSRQQNEKCPGVPASTRGVVNPYEED